MDGSVFGRKCSASSELLKKCLQCWLVSMRKGLYSRPSNQALMKLDLHSVSLMDRGIAAICRLARTLPASHPVLVPRLVSLLRASFRSPLTARPLRFAITSPSSGFEEHLHLPAVEHSARQRDRPWRRFSQPRERTWMKGSCSFCRSYAVLDCLENEFFAGRVHQKCSKQNGDSGRCRSVFRGMPI
jgi:hypothetical protein